MVCACVRACVCVEALAFILETYLIQQAFNKGSITEYQLIIWQQRERLSDAGQGAPVMTGAICRRPSEGGRAHKRALGAPCPNPVFTISFPNLSS